MKTPCKYPGCAALLDSSGYCPDHLASAPKPREQYERWRKRDSKQSTIDRFRSTAAWQHARRQKMAANPLCEDPFGTHAAKQSSASTQQIHHIKPLVTHYELRLHWDNLMSVCTACHARLEAEAKAVHYPTTPPGGRSKV